MLGGASLIEWLGENIKELLPVCVVPPYAQGVRMFCGRIYDHGSGHPWTGNLSPGLWLRMPWVWPIEVVHVVPQVVNLPTQTVTTADGLALSFSANIQFEIDDATASWTKVQNVSDSVSFLCMSVLARKIRACTLQESLDGARELERSIERSLSTRLKEWGVRVTDVGLTDMVRSRALRIYGDPLKGIIG